MSRLSLAPVLLTLALAACGKPAPEGKDASETGAIIPCALHGAAAFKPDCTVERSTAGDSIVLTLHHRDGGFRRLQVATDGRGVVTADGSETAIVKVVSPGSIEVVVGDDRYRLPATVKGEAVPAR